MIFLLNFTNFESLMAFVLFFAAIIVTVALVPSVISAVIPAVVHVVINAFNAPVAGS